MFSILQEMPLLTGILVAVWLPVIFITLRHLYTRKDIAKSTKLIWLLIGLIPLVGVIIYGLINFKTNKAILLAAVFAIASSATAGWYFISYMPTQNRRDVTKEQGVGITAKNIVEAFLQNENEANAKYVNKVVEVSGVVEKVEENELGSVIFLLTEVEGNSLSASLKSKQTVLPNTQVVVKGILSGYVINTVQLTEAVIISGADTSIKKDITKPVAPQKDTVTTKPITDTTPKQKDKYQSTTSQIKFFSSTAAENIEAINTQVISSLQTNGNIQFAALIKGFRFENELMQKHFNEEGYLHSDKYPKAEFKGTINNISNLNFTKNGEYGVTAKGSLTIHGVTQNITAPGTITIKNGTIKLNSVFKIRVQDYKIDGSDVAEKIEITVNCTYK